MLIMVSANVFANVTAINIPSQYSNKSESITYSVTYDGAGPVLLNISSQRYPSGLDYNFSGVSGTNGLFITDLSSGADSSVNSETGTPTIAVNPTDVVTISGNGFQDSIIVDSVGPNNSARPTISSFGGQKFGNFYSGAITVNDYAPQLTDAYTFIDKHIVYLITVDSLDYDNTIKTYVDANTVSTKNINPLSEEIDDGNYFVLIDANDIAGNFSDVNYVIDTKQNVYFDNTKPVIGSVNLGTIDDSNRIYIKDVPFDLNIMLSDVSGIKEGSIFNLITPKIPINNIPYNQGFNISSALIADSITGHTIVSGDVFQVSIDANDNVNNNFVYDFNIIVDLNAPTRPTNNTTTIEDVDKNVTISWTNTSTDTGSGLKEYRVYKSTSNFTTITNQTLICTVALGGTYNCKDTSNKSANTTLYYGVVGVDNAGNISDANVQSIKTGPSCDLEINDGNKFTKLPTVNLYLNYSNDVNEMSFSCNGTTFSSYVEVDENATFNITSGNGCTTTNEEKTIYARVKSKDDPTRTTRCSAEIYYDTNAPPIPTNIRATTQPNGSIKVMWNASEDTNTDSDILYKIYYSTQNNVTASSPFFETESTNYIHTLNQDTNVYYKLSATDEAGNESSLSATVIGSARKVGASLTITIMPSNDYNNIIYVGAGNKKIKYTSDESLLGTPQVSIKQGPGSFVSIPTTYNSSTKSGESDYSFTTSGTGTVKIIAVNTRNETSTSEFNFTIDANIPNFDYNFSQNGATYIFTVRDFPPDSYRVQYLLNNTTEICLKHKTDTNFNCIFDSNNTADGNYTLNILLYDFALNFTQKQLSFVIDNIDEDLISATELKSELDINVETIGQNLELFLALGLKDLDTSLNLKFDLAKADKSDGDNLFKEAKYIEANAKYLSAKNLITEINQNMPKIEIINSLETEYVYDENTSIPLNLISDVNITKDTLDLYKTKNISITRNFEVIQINNQKYFSVTLVINNTSSSDKTITVIEDIPKSFANSVELLSFTQIVDILLKDPVISYTATVPKNSTKEITYRLMKPITDVDAVTKVTTLNNTFMQPVVLSGSVSRDKISVKKVIDKNIFIYLISIIFLFILILIIINAITNYKTKQVKVEIKPDAKKEMADYLGTIKKENVENKDLENTVKEVDEKKKSADKFQENYDYILSAIKKR